MQTGTRFKSLQPLIPAPDVDAAVSFYRESLGFEHAWSDGKPATMSILYRGDVEIFLVQSPAPDAPLHTSLRIRVENIDALYKDYESKRVIHPNGKLKTQPWGLKEFTILDLNRVCIAFHESPKAVDVKAKPANTALETERLGLHPLSAEHLEAMHALYSNPETMKHWHTLPHTSKAETERLFQEKIATSSWWAIQEKTSQKVIGLVGCHSVEDSKSCGLGYILEPKSQGQGLAAEATKAVIGHLFTNWNVPYIDLWIYDDNTPSIRLAERLGFKKENSFERSGPDTVSKKKAGSYWLRQSHWWQFLQPKP